MNGSEPVLAVYLGDKVIAHLALRQQLVWQYTRDWQREGFAVSPHLPLSGDIEAQDINRFLRNLLPEGGAFDELIQNVHVSRNNTFALIRTLGMDVSGALVLTDPETGLPQEGYFRLLTKEELINRLDQPDRAGLIIWDGKPRLSVAGVQDKINLIINSQGQMGFGEGALCSTHILKFERQSQSHLVLNEYVTLRLAKQCGLKVAKATLRRFGSHIALLVERFDRKLMNDDEVKRRHIIDGCQALNLSPEYKYERHLGSGRDVAHIRDGANLPQLFHFIKSCQNPVLDRQQLLDWVLFNIVIYNVDAHGKNISFYVGSQGISLAPFYDLVNIKLYPHVEQQFAMAIGDEFDSENINAYQIADFAESCGLPKSYVAKRFKQILEKLSLALPGEMLQITSEFGCQSYFAEYQNLISLRCQQLLKQCPDIKKISV